MNGFWLLISEKKVCPKIHKITNFSIKYKDGTPILTLGAHARNINTKFKANP